MAPDGYGCHHGELQRSTGFASAGHARNARAQRSDSAMGHFYSGDVAGARDTSSSGSPLRARRTQTRGGCLHSAIGPRGISTVRVARTVSRSHSSRGRALGEAAIASRARDWRDKSRTAHELGARTGDNALSRTRLRRRSAGRNRVRACRCAHGAGSIAETGAERLHQFLDLAKVIDVVAGHRLDDGSEGHLAALGMRDGFDSAVGPTARMKNMFQRRDAVKASSASRASSAGYGLVQLS